MALLVPDRFADDLFDRGDAGLDLDQAAAAQGDHALLDGLLLDLLGLGPGEDQLPDGRGDLHDLEQAGPALVAGVVAERRSRGPA